MLIRTETTIRTPLEAAKVPLRVARWVAGGHTREARARRADVALYARARLDGEGWPDPWLLNAFADHDAARNHDRRNRGLHRLTVEETCAAFAPPSTPPPKRTTKRQREAAENAEQLATLLERAAAQLRDHAAATAAGAPRAPAPRPSTAPSPKVDSTTDNTR